MFLTILKHLFVIVFILFYPIAISTYPIWPLFIGLFGLILIRGIDENRFLWIVYATFYLLNIETNLSLPILLSLAATLMAYLLFYSFKKLIRFCKICRYILIIFLVDSIYVALLFIYSYLKVGYVWEFDSIYLYWFVIDLLAAVLL